MCTHKHMCVCSVHVCVNMWMYVCERGCEFVCAQAHGCGCVKEWMNKWLSHLLFRTS